MTAKELSSISNCTWLGRIRIVKPKSNEKLGISYQGWHHLAIIGDYVFIYVWDTREIIDVYRLEDITAPFETVKVVDNGKPIFISSKSTERARNAVNALRESMPDLPIMLNDTSVSIKAIRETAESALLNVDIDHFDCMDDASVVFVDKSLPLPAELYMFTESEAINPAKRKLVDNNAYIGYQKYLAIIARCKILEDWSKQL